MVVCACCNSSSWEAGAGGWRVQGQPEICSNSGGCRGREVRVGDPAPHCHPNRQRSPFSESSNLSKLDPWPCWRKDFQDKLIWKKLEFIKNRKNGSREKNRQTCEQMWASQGSVVLCEPGCHFSRESRPDVAGQQSCIILVAPTLHLVGLLRFFFPTPFGKIGL